MASRHFPSNSKYGVSFIMISPLMVGARRPTRARVGNVPTAATATADATNCLRENSCVLSVLPLLTSTSCPHALIPVLEQLPEHLRPLFPLGSALPHPLLHAIQTRRSHAARPYPAHLLRHRETASFEDREMLPYRRQRDAEVSRQLRYRHGPPAQPIHDCPPRSISKRIEYPVDIHSILRHYSAFLLFGDHRYQVVGQYIPSVLPPCGSIRSFKERSLVRDDQVSSALLRHQFEGHLRCGEDSVSHFHRRCGHNSLTGDDVLEPCLVGDYRPGDRRIGSHFVLQDLCPAFQELASKFEEFGMASPSHPPAHLVRFTQRPKYDARRLRKTALNDASGMHNARFNPGFHPRLQNRVRPPLLKA